MEKSENLSRGSEISYVEVLWAMRMSLLMVLCRLDSTVTRCGWISEKTTNFNGSSSCL